VAEKEAGLDGTVGQFLPHQFVAKALDAGTGVDNDQLVVAIAEFQAGGVAAVANGICSRDGDRPANTPES
jgi:hypothetical protein